MGCLLFCDAVYDPAHLLLAAGIVSLAEDCLLLVLRHGGIGVQRPGIPGKSHPKPNGNLIIVHTIASLGIVSTVPESFIAGNV